MTELNLLLGFLAFLAVRTDFIRRRVMYVIALVCWGLARFFTEYTFKPTGEGTLMYKYASFSGYAAALSIFLCVLFLFLACLGSRPHRRVASVPPDEEETAADGDESLSPSERLRKLVDEE
jgi:prolipoprotein diacylglyceryltransferase